MSHAQALPSNSESILATRNFLSAIREAGYLSLSTALAELVDNSIEADAQHVDVTISRRVGDDQPVIRVVDDGHGMTQEEMQQCLRFGGTIQFDRRESFGRFGMGLPMASLSQARRVEVVSWQDGHAPSQVCLDVDDGLSCASTLPAQDQQSSGWQDGGVSGCVVTWKRCDKVDYQRLGWADKAVRRDLGRTYRRFLDAGLHITVNGAAVDSVDHLMVSTVIDGAHARLAFDPLTYDVKTTTGAVSTVTVRFSLLPVAAWHDLDNASKKRHGIVGTSGVSILRAGREVARGWLLMGGKRKENYDDWWRCEICFEPDLDEQFGITINKQGIRPSSELRAALEPELESIARMLNSRVRKVFEDVRFQEASQASCRIAADADCDLPVIGGQAQMRGPLRYCIDSQALPDSAMLRTTLKERTLRVTLNMDHPAFSALYHPLQTLAEKPAADLRTAVELLVLSFARSAVLLQESGWQYDDLIGTWSTTYGRMLRKS